MVHIKKGWLRRNLWVTTIVATVMALNAGLAFAGVEVMNFNGLQASGEYIQNYYNGGAGSQGSAGGPNYGVAWVNAEAGGAPNGLYSNVANEPAGPNVMGLTSTSSSFMNVAGGLTKGFSFYYSAPYPSKPGSVSVYSGLNGTGTQLATITLPSNGTNPSFSQNFSKWTPVGVNFSGTAKSVDFSGAANYIVFDAVTLGSATPYTSVPSPGSLSLFAVGLFGLAFFASDARRRGAST